MTIFIASYITLLGLVLGSFYNVVALRVPAKESLLNPPSHCPNCNTRLKARDLLPVVSYLLSGGKCRYCGTRISPLYPLGEAATGLLFLWVYLQFGLTGKGIIGFILVSLAVIVTVADLKYMLIPNKVLLFFTSAADSCTTISRRTDMASSARSCAWGRGPYPFCSIRWHGGWRCEVICGCWAW